ncbi:Non-histone chromosomal protein HMG-14 [Manis javanica]|nr:Non-histone chromosomal protein HMG-14 [Manis javanica]
MPQRKVSSVKGMRKGEPRRSARLLAQSAPAMVEMKPKRAAGKDKSLGQKVQTYGKRGQRANRPKWLTRNLNTTLQKTET